MPYKGNEPQRHKSPRVRYRIESWAEYDAAPRRRGSLGEAPDDRRVGTGDNRTAGPAYSDVAIDDAAPGFRSAMASDQGLAGLDPARPGSHGARARQGQRSCHTPFSCFSADLGVATALKKASDPVHVVIDSSGLTVFGIGCTGSMAASHAGLGESSIWRLKKSRQRPNPRFRADPHGRRRRVVDRPAARPDHVTEP
jgi:hypothetical protein